MINSSNPENDKSPSSKSSSTWLSLGVAFDILRCLNGSLENSFHPTYYQEEIFKTFMDNPHSIIHLTVDGECTDQERMLGYVIPILNHLRIINDRETASFGLSKSKDLKKVVSQQALLIGFAATQELASNAAQIFNTKPLGGVDINYDSVDSLAKIQMNLPEKSSRCTEFFMGSVEDFMKNMDNYPKETKDGLNIGRLKAVVIEDFDAIYMNLSKKQLLAFGNLLQRLRSLMPIMVITKSCTKKFTEYMNAIFDKDIIKVRRTLSQGSKENLTNGKAGTSPERQSRRSIKEKLESSGKKEVTKLVREPGTLHLQNSNIDFTESNFIHIKALEESLKMINEKLASFEVRMVNSIKQTEGEVCTFREALKHTAQFQKLE